MIGEILGVKQIGKVVNLVKEVMEGFSKELLALSLGYKQTHIFNGLFYGLPNREHIREGVGVNFCQNQPNIRFIVCLWVY